MDEIKDWILKHKVTHVATNNLSEILRNYGIVELPKDSRSFLRTARSVTLLPMGTDGEYWHNGVKAPLLSCLNNIGVHKPMDIFLKLNIDGLPLYKSCSKAQFWPILVLIDNFKTVKPFIAGIYSGENKPSNLNDFLKPVVEELKCLLETGLVVNGYSVTVGIKCFICDTPARCFIKGTVSFNHYHGCSKCTIVGEYCHNGHHMSFPRVNAPKRTDLSFRTKSDSDHHKTDTILEQLPIDLIEDFPVADSLHLFDLGIMKRCLIGWTQGSFNFRTKLSAREINELSQLLHYCNYTRPSELHRAIRRLDHLRFWKTVEFRVLGPVLLRDYLPTDAFYHFLTLFCAVTICTSSVYSKYLDLADELFHDYIEKFIELYGIDSVTSNVHNLCHVVDDVKKFGILPNISAYPFENALYAIKNLLRNGHKPLAQVAKRLSEVPFISSDVNKKLFPYCSKENEAQGNLNCKFFNKIVLAEGLSLENDDKNKWFMTKHCEIVELSHITKVGKKTLLHGKSFVNLYNLFEHPFSSCYINIFASRGEKVSQKVYKVNEIKCKVFLIRHYDEMIFMPILHSLDLMISNT